MITTQHYSYMKTFFFSLLFVLYSGLTIAEEWNYTTRPGDTLWDISKKYLKNPNDWNKLQKHNAIDIAKRLSPGTRLRIPIEWLKDIVSPAIVVNISGKVTYSC